MRKKVYLQLVMMKVVPKPLSLFSTTVFFSNGKHLFLRQTKFYSCNLKNKVVNVHTR